MTDPADKSIANDKTIEYLGFALFNLYKGNTHAAITLVRKAYIELTGKEWDG